MSEEQRKELDGFLTNPNRTMKYTKGNQTYKLEDCGLLKLRLTDGDDFSETPWAKYHPGEAHVVLQNTALAFTPYPSWGATIPAISSFNFVKMLYTQTLELHPEAWEYYIEQGVIDENGNYQKDWEQKKKGENS